MTQPSPPPDQQAQQAQLEQFAVHAAELYALEKVASAAVVGPLRKQLAAVNRALSVLWITRFGSLDAPADPVTLRHVVTQVKADLATVDPAVADRLGDYAAQALKVGVQHAGQEAGTNVVVQTGTRNRMSGELRGTLVQSGAHGEEKPERATRIDWPTGDLGGTAPRRPGRGTRRDWPTIDVDPVLDDTTRHIIATIDRDVQQHLHHAADALDRVSGDTYRDVSDALTQSQKAVTAVDRAATVVVNKASNTGSDAVSEALGAERLWLAERDACLHCLAYAGEVAAVGASFPVGLTFGKKPLTPWPDPHFLGGPELHPFCRCRTTPWLGHAEGAPGPSLPEVLKREAQRSILKGWRMETEPESARLAAAARLLARGVNAPNSVKDYARRAIKKRRFPTRTFPESSS